MNLVKSKQIKGNRYREFMQLFSETVSIDGRYWQTKE